MTNHSEEIEKLSYEEETHFNSNDNFNKMSEGDSNENLYTNKKNKINNQNQNLNEEINKSSEQNGIENNNNINIDSKLKNFAPNQHLKNYGQPFNHNHMLEHYYHQNHNFRNPKYIFYFILQYLKIINQQIQQFYGGLCLTLDMFIRNSNYHPLIKKILHTKQILLLIYIFDIQYLLSSIENIYFLKFLNKITLNSMIFFIICLYVHYYFYNDKLFLKKDEEMEKYILKRNPQMKKCKCQECDLLKVMRSNHCFFCKKCVHKFQLHSDWFNMCIGSTNELLYATTLLFVNIYIFISNIIFWFYILFRADLLNYLFLIFSLFAVVGIYILFNSIIFFYYFIFENLFTNLTLYEKNNSRRLTYLWENSRNKKFFNPFNKGIQRNLEEMWINLFDMDIYSDYKKFTCQNLTEIIDDEDKEKKVEDEFDEFDDMISYKLMIRLTEHIDPLITSKGNIYKFVDGKEIINWNRLMLFTAFDIINSPFKDYMVKYAKNMLIQRELYIRSLILHNIENEKEIIDTNEQSNEEENNENNENIEEDKDKENNNEKTNENNIENSNEKSDNNIENIEEDK